MQKDAREYRDDCPLIPVSDRLAEERKMVVQEIRGRAYGYCIDPEVLDQIERGEWWKLVFINNVHEEALIVQIATTILGTIHNISIRQNKIKKIN